MKKIILFSFFLFVFCPIVSSQSFAQPYKFTVDKPNERIQLKEIKIFPDSTEIVFSTPTGGPLYKPGSETAFYIRDIDSNKKYRLRSIGEKFEQLWINPNTEVHLFFDKIPAKTKNIDLIDGQEYGRNWRVYGIRIVRDHPADIINLTRENRIDSLNLVKKHVLDSLNLIRKTKQENINSTRYIQNNFLINRFFTVKQGDCYIHHDDQIFKLMNNSGDIWHPVFSNLTSFTKDPSNANILYRITESKEVSKSMNNGDSWIVIQNGLPADSAFNQIIVNPHNSSDLFLLSNNAIYKSADAGFTWQLFKQYNNIQQFAINTQTQDTYYILSSDSVFLSKDAGQTWKNISNTLPAVLIKGVGRTAEFKPLAVYSIANINTADSSYIMAFTSKGIFRTGNDGISWNEINTGIDKTNLIYATYISGNDIYIGGVETSGDTIKSTPVLYTSAVDKIYWTEISLKKSGLEPINGIYKDNTHPGIYISTTDNKISYIDTQLNVISLNYGFTPHSIIHAFGISKRENKNVYYAVILNTEKIDIQNDGLWYSENEGKCWESIWLNESYNINSKNKIFVSPYNSSEIWVFDNSHNYKTFNGGADWLDNDMGLIDNIRFDSKNRNVMFCTHGEGVTNLQRYDKSTNGSTTILDDDIEQFIIARDDNKKILTDNGKLSMDGGWTWNEVVNFNALPNRNPDYGKCSIIPINIIGNQLTIAAFGNQNSTLLSFLSSEDNGNNWTWKSDNFDGCIMLYSNQNDPSKIIRVNLIKSANSRNYEALNVYQSKDNARSWKQVFTLSKNNIQLYTNSTNLDDSMIMDFITTIYTDVTDGKDLIYLGFKSGGMIYSNDNGENWTKIGGIYENN